MPYTRIIPRDLFNEAKLLKCIGQLALAVHDELIPLRMFHDGRAFVVEQNPASGGLFVANVHFSTVDGQSLHLETNYNSKDPYPLFAELDDEVAYVFDDEGNVTDEFLALISNGAIDD